MLPLFLVPSSHLITTLAATSISEVRMNTRWDRCLLNNSFNFERGLDGLRQPTYR